MNDQLINERWYQLCQLAAAEPDSDKVLAIVEEVNRLLDERNAAITATRRGPTSVQDAAF